MSGATDARIRAMAAQICAEGVGPGELVDLLDAADRSVGDDGRKLLDDAIAAASAAHAPCGMCKGSGLICPSPFHEDSEVPVAWADHLAEVAARGGRPEASATLSGLTRPVKCRRCGGSGRGRQGAAAGAGR